MNDSYPSSTDQYDFAFLNPLIKSAFERDELIECGKTKYIINLNRSKLKFAKAKFLVLEI